MSAKQQHPFHLVDLSPWPILTAFSLLFATLGAVFLMHGHSMAEYLSIFGGGAVVFCSYCWWKDVIKEGRVGHHHTEKVRMGLRIGMALFILSEAMFFFGFFFSFFVARFFFGRNIRRFMGNRGRSVASERDTNF